METWMKFLQRQVTTLIDSQRLGRWDRLEVYLSDRKRPWKTANDPVILFVLYGNKQNTSGDRQRLAVSTFGAKSSNLNERLWKTVNGHEYCQRPWKTASQPLAVIPKDPETRMTAKDSKGPDKLMQRAGENSSLIFTVCVKSVPRHHFKLASVVLQMAVKEFFETLF